MLDSFAHTDFSVERLLGLKSAPITVCVPARETAERIGATVERLVPLCERGLVDQLLVIDADSADGTAEVARAAGAEVHSENDLMPAWGPAQGKGDAMWRGLSVARGEVIVFLDGDVSDCGEHYVVGLLGPLLTRTDLDFVKGYYRRPFSVGGRELPDGGGRVTELVAKPLLALTAPELAGFRQPLAGEMAGRRALFESIPFTTAYGVEIAMLVEIWSRIGLERMAQVDLGSKRNDHQALAELSGMAGDVTEALAEALKRHGAAGTGAITPAPGQARRLDLRPPLRDAKLEQQARSSGAARESAGASAAPPRRGGAR